MYRIGLYKIDRQYKLNILKILHVVYCLFNFVEIKSKAA
jgi:hypothetical protein